MFSRKIFAPALIIVCKTSADSVAGPRVQMILVFRMREGSGKAPAMPAERGWGLISQSIDRPRYPAQGAAGRGCPDSFHDVVRACSCEPALSLKSNDSG